MNKTVFVSLLVWLLNACTTTEKPYTHYLMDPQVNVPSQFVDKGEGPVPKATEASDRSIKSRWNDGKVYTEVEIPVISSGQRIVIEHESRQPEAKKPGPELILPAPNANDSSHHVMHNAYLAKGLKEDTKAREISLSHSRIKMDEAVKGHNYSMALQIIEKVLARYPSHAEFLRAKGSVMLLLGEKPSAIEAYEKAQDIEFDPSVERKLKELDQ